jgi:hypothetical protein
MTGTTTVDYYADRLRRAGWSTGDACLDDGTWLVTGTNGENAIRARAGSQIDAWQNAAGQARLMGILRK